ncbi:MAG: GNAT family N-acetyltransferase [Flavobacteriales bacterium]|nr:GNAT family N-acetyltransferase [Flavobacteriales bacterium]
MKIVDTKILSDSHKKDIYTLWNKEYPKNLSYSKLSQFDDYLRKLDEQSHLLLIDEQEKIKGWYFSFDRANEHWFAMILDTSIQGNGWGTKLLNTAKEKDSILNAWGIDHSNDVKQDGTPYSSPIEFYLKNGFEIISSERLELDHISAVKIRWDNSFSHSPSD